MRSTFLTRVRDLHQIEVTSRCNLKCEYCISSTMPRSKLDMSDDHFEGALDLIKYFIKRETQQDVNMAGTGEPLLHPKFIEYLIRVREVIGKRKLLFTTNGLLLDLPTITAIKPLKPLVFLTQHQLGPAAKAIWLLTEHKIDYGISTHALTDPNNWAGQVSWPVGEYRDPTNICLWFSSGSVFLRADGKFQCCCLDGHEDRSVIGEIGKPLTCTSPSSLCRTCHITLGAQNVDQNHVYKYPSIQDLQGQFTLDEINENRVDLPRKGWGDL